MTPEELKIARAFVVTEETREELAALEHQQWAHWTKYMLGVLEPLLGQSYTLAGGLGSWLQARAALARWRRQIETPYADLAEQEKNSDREWADKVIAIIQAAPEAS